MAGVNGFHYIFDSPPVLTKTLQGSFHPYVTGSLSTFHVAPNGVTTGTMTLTMVPSAPANEVDAAVRAGFIRSTDGVTFTAVLRGERYASRASQAGPEYVLNKAYDIDVISEQSANDARVTPITIVGGALALVGVPLFAIALLFSCAVQGTLSNCHE
jgi:hypothetical protein